MVTVPVEATWVEFDVSGSPSTGPFAFGFPYFAKADLDVRVNGTRLTTSQFTDTPGSGSATAGYDGGSITLGSAAAVGAKVSIARDTIPSRTVNLTGGGMTPTAIDAALNKLTMLDQEHKRDIDRSFKFPVDEDRDFTMASASDRADKFYYFDSNGDPALGANGTTSTLLADIADLTPTDSNIIVGNGTTWVAENGATARTSLGLGTGDSPNFTGFSLGASATFTALLDDDTMAAASATSLSSSESIVTFTTSGTQTLSNKTINSNANTITLDLSEFSLSGTLANFNSACLDATFVSTSGAETLTNKTLVSPVLNTSVSGTAVLDEDDMASDSATKLATQRSTKAFINRLGRVFPHTCSADGSTDDATALQAVITAAADAGQIVHLGDDDLNYRIASGLSLPAGTIIESYGAKIFSDHTGAGMSVAGHNVRIEGVEIYSDQADISITGITAASPAVATITAANLSLANSDRVRIPALSSGMVEIGGRSFALAGKSGDTYNLQEEITGSGLTNQSASGYTAWSGTVAGLAYKASLSSHVGIFCQNALFNNGVNATFIEDLIIRNCHVHGFGATGIRADFTRRLKIIENHVERCGLHGILASSPIDYDISRNTVENIGPGATEDNPGYGISVSRVVTYNDATLGASTEANLTEATGSPRPKDGRICENSVHDVQDYIAIDSHTCDGLVVEGNTTRDCLVGYNAEQAGTATYPATSDSVKVVGNTFSGNSSSYNSHGPGVAIDCGSFGQVAEAISVIGNTIEKHGQEGNFNPFGASLVPLAAVYSNYSDGVTVIGNTFRDNYRYDAHFAISSTNFVFEGNTSTGLQETASTRIMVRASGAGTTGRIGGNTFKNAGGSMLELTAATSRLVNIAENETVTAGLDVAFDGGSVSGGANMMTAATEGYLRIGKHVSARKCAFGYTNSSHLAAVAVSAVHKNSGEPLVLECSGAHGASDGARVWTNNDGVTTPGELGNALWLVNIATKVSHGAVTGGPFTLGETVTQATSGATGVVVHVGSGFLVLDVTSGTFDGSNGLTGGTSGATATASAAAVSCFVLPDTDSDDFGTASSATGYFAIEPYWFVQSAPGRVLKAICFNSTGYTDIYPHPDAFSSLAYDFGLNVVSSAQEVGRVYTASTTKIQFEFRNSGGSLANPAAENISASIGGV